MKKRQLTDLHKSKLLEMINKLFPEYRKTIITDGKFDDSLPNVLCLHTEYDETNGLYSYIMIHWFEFCITQLVDKIQQALPEHLVWREQPEYVNCVFDWKKGNMWTLYSEFFFNYPKRLREEHPIDYLYKEFKKIKL